MEINEPLNIFDKLPLEIIFEIVKYLKYNDIKKLRLVSRRYKKILNDIFIKRTRYVIFLSFLDSSDSELRCYYPDFLNKTKNFFNIRLHYDHYFRVPKKAPILFKDFCNGIIDLSICLEENNLDVLCNWLKCLQNLRSIDLECEYFGYYASGIDNIISILFDRVDVIRITFPFSISFDVIEKIAIERISTIKELELHLSDIFTNNYQQHICKSGFILLLKKVSKSLKKATIVSSFYSIGNLLLGLSEIELDLNSLTLEFSHSFDLYDFEKFAIRMKDLEYLEIINTHICDKSVELICTVIKKLKVLNIQCFNITNKCINFVGNLELLETLKLCWSKKNTGSTQRAYTKINENMKKIQLDGFWDDASVITIVTNFPNLKSLIFCTEFDISAKSLLLIYNSLQKLRKLHIQISCITTEKNEVSVDSSIDKLYHLEDLNLEGIEIDIDKISRIKNLKYLSIDKHCMVCSSL